MLTVSCREVGMDCDYVCKGETEKENYDKTIEEKKFIRTLSLSHI
jgi:hypothetical protein